MFVARSPVPVVLVVVSLAGHAPPRMTGAAGAAGPAATVPFQTIPYFDGHFVTVEAEDFHSVATPSWRAAEWGVDPNYFCSAVL